MRRAVLVALAAGLTVGLVAAPAQAKVKKVKVETEVVIDEYAFSLKTGDVTFFGHVGSEKRRCLRNRTIRLREGESGFEVGSDTTDDTGGWEVSFEPASGDYQASADKRKYKKRRHGEVVKKIVCLPDTSNVVSLKG